MYSDNFVNHMFEKANQLIAIQRNKRVRAHEKLDYNLKRMLDHLPKQLKNMTVSQLLTNFDGDLDSAAQKLVVIETPNLHDQKLFQSPPKIEAKKRNLKNKHPN